MPEWIQSADEAVLFLIQEHLRSPFLDAVMSFFSILGNYSAVWLAAAAILLCFPAHRKYGWMLLCGILLATLAGELILKPLIGRIRPYGLYPSVPLAVTRPKTFSFPSGHSASSFSAAAVLFSDRKSFGAAALAAALLIAFSRSYLFLHYPSDILAGMLLGAACGRAAVWTVRRISEKRRNRTGP